MAQTRLRDWTLLLRTLVLGVFVVLLGGWSLWFRGRLKEHERQLADKQEEIETLHGEVAERDRRIEQLEAALRLLKVDHRLARIIVLEQTPDATTLEFQEIGADNLPLGAPKVFTLRGDIAYVDALVIKFDDSLVEAGDALRGTSVCLFRRLFGEYQQPSDGFPLDPVGMRPLPYSVEGEASPLESDLWRRFWDYANDPSLAEQHGVRAVHGEAPYMELRPDARYIVELRASGGLSIRPEPSP
ncbi:MAG: hypothetical protein EYC70_08345 [Planctomycetota bacterium]|nr:MAG: hypothetical protein EYC70_08345 [Planctomycetota bacterium]